MLVAPSSLSWRMDLLRLVSVLLAGLAGRTLAEDERIIGGTVVAGSERSSFSLILISHRECTYGRETTLSYLLSV